MWRHSRCLLFERQRRGTAILDIVEERAPITVRVTSAYALFVRELASALDENLPEY